MQAVLAKPHKRLKNFLISFEKSFENFEFLNLEKDEKGALKFALVNSSSL